MAAAESADIGEMVKKWATQMFEYTKSKEQGKIAKEHLQYTINWKKVKFTHHDPEYLDKLKPPQPKSQTLFKTYFTNNTDQEQEYSFKTERTTQSTCEVEIEKGFTIEQEMSMSLKSPCEVFEASAGFRREMSLTNVQGESFEQELCWGVDSVIKVPKKTKATAELVISEDEFEGGFTVLSTIAGTVLVTITNLKDNNSLVKTLEGNIAEIVKRELENGLRGFKVDRNVVSFTTTGKCHFRYAIEQHVKISQEPLEED